MNKVFITGGAGFIGTAIAKHFSKNGFKIKTFDIVDHDNVIDEHVRATIMYPEELYQEMKGCDYVIHLAAQLGVQRTENRRMDCLDINIQGSKNVFEAAVKAGVKKIIFVSSSEVYGEPIKNPISESDMVSPKSVYAVTKLAGEEYIKAFSKEYGINYSIVRFFNVYGPGQVAEFVMPRFIKAVLENKPPVVYGDGNQSRSFCHVDDAAQGVYLMLKSKKANGEIFNIGNDKAKITMKDLVHKVISLSDKNIKPRFISIENSDRTQEREIIERCVDITKARTMLNYQPRISLDDGILDVLRSGNIKATWRGYKK